MLTIPKKFEADGMTIGERLEEARKRRGISIREAAEATKVRGDYLLAMEENNTHTIELPEIYRRGFLKNYARLLKLDPDKIITDYEAKQLTSSPEIQHRSESDGEAREVFGRMELPEEEEAGPSAQRFQKQPSEEPRERRIGLPKGASIDLTDNTLYLKIGAGVAAVLILAILITILVNLLRGDPSPAINPELAGNATTTTAPAGTEVAAQSPSSLTIRALDNVTLIIDQENPAERLYQGTLSAGDVIPIEKQGPVSIRFSNGEALLIEKPNGQSIRPSESSIGRIVVP